MNNIIYEGIASRKSYILLSVTILLLSTFLVKYGVINAYGQQSTVNSTAEQVNPSLGSQDKGQQLAIPEPSANDLSTVERQSGTINDGNKEKAAEIQEKQNMEDETTRNSVDDNVDSNEDSDKSQPEEPKADDDQNRNDKQDSESENEDENDVESEENDTPLDFEATTGLDDDEDLPFP